MTTHERGAVVLTFTCPRCGYRCDSASSVLGADAARPGDLSLCLLCAAPLELRADGAPRWLTYDETAEVVRTNARAGRLLVAAIIAIITTRPPRVRAVQSPRGPSLE